MTTTNEHPATGHEHHDHQNGHGHGHGHAHGHGHGHGHDHGAAEQPDFSTMIDYLELDGEVFAEYHADVLDAVVDEATAGGREAASVTRVADLGCGTGTATLPLARLFPQATVLPVDVSQALLDHVVAKAAGEGTAQRLVPLAADLDTAWPEDLHDLDVVWASTSIHHLADPPAALRAIRERLAPGGLLALVEVDDLHAFHPSFLPDGLDRRLRDPLADEWRAMMPMLGADWTQALTDAGYEIVGGRTYQLRVTAQSAGERADAVARYAELSLARLREQLRKSEGGAEADPADVAALDAVLAGGLGGLTDLAAESRRRLYLARPA